MCLPTDDHLRSLVDILRRWTAIPRASPPSTRSPSRCHTGPRSRRVSPASPESSASRRAWWAASSRRDGGFDVLITGVGVLRYARDDWCRATGPGPVRRAAGRRLGRAPALCRARGRPSARAPGDSPTRAPTPICAASSPSRSHGRRGSSSPAARSRQRRRSVTYWEYRKAIEQALRADPNTLELLFVPSARAVDPWASGCWRRGTPSSRPSIFGSFGRYAMSQLGKLARSRGSPSTAGSSSTGWRGARAGPRRGRRAPREASAAPGTAARRRDPRAKEYMKQLYRVAPRPGTPGRERLRVRSSASRAADGRSTRTRPRAPAEERLQPAAADPVATGWLRDGAPTLRLRGAPRTAPRHQARPGRPGRRPSRRGGSSSPPWRRRATRRPAAEQPDLTRADASSRDQRGARAALGPRGPRSVRRERAATACDSGGAPMTTMPEPQQQRVADWVLDQESAARGTSWSLSRARTHTASRRPLGLT